MFRILVADDEIKIRETIKDYLSAKGFDVVMAGDGAQAISLAEEKEFDLILLDVMMPVKDGIETCRELRGFTQTPILFLSALGEEENLLKGYRSGADDYIVKPFPLAVLCEKINALIKRNKGLDSENVIEHSQVKLNLDTRQSFCKGKEMRLTPKDFDLLYLLMRNRGIVLSRDIILSKIWGYDFEGDTRTVDTHIKNLRKALGEKAGLIVTTSCVGYSFKKEE